MTTADDRYIYNNKIVKSLKFYSFVDGCMNYEVDT